MAMVLLDISTYLVFAYGGPGGNRALAPPSHRASRTQMHSLHFIQIQRLSRQIRLDRTSPES